MLLVLIALARGAEPGATESPAAPAAAVAAAGSAGDLVGADQAVLRGNLQGALDLYARFAAASPESADAPRAALTAARLKAGLGDHAGAAMLFELYPRMFPGAPDGGSALAAGQQWTQVSDEAGAAYFRRFLATAPGPADTTVRATVELARLEQRMVDPRGAETWARVRHAYADAWAAGAPISGTTRALVGARRVEELQDELRALPPVTWSGDEAEDVSEFFARMEVAKGLVRRASAAALAYEDFDTVMAAVYLMVVLRLDGAHVAVSLPVPAGLDEEERSIYDQLLREQFVTPMLDAAKRAYVDTLQGQAEKQRWSSWSDRARAELSREFPGEFPVAHPELRAITAPTAKMTSPARGRRARRKGDEPAAWDLVEQASALLAAGNADLAEVLLDAGERGSASPATASDLALRAALHGRVAVLRGDSEAARAHMLAALDADPAQPLALAWMGGRDLDEHAFQGAATVYEHAISVAPDIAELHLDLGIAYRGLDRANDARREYQRAAELAPGSFEPWWNLAVLDADYLGDKPAAVRDLAACQARGGPAAEIEGWRGALGGPGEEGVPR